MTKCARCGNDAQGYATIGLLRYCHGDQEQPTCYMRQNWDNMRARLAEHAAESLDMRDCLLCRPARTCTAATNVRIVRNGNSWWAWGAR